MWLTGRHYRRTEPFGWPTIVIYFLYTHSSGFLTLSAPQSGQIWVVLSNNTCSHSLSQAEHLSFTANSSILYHFLSKCGLIKGNWWDSNPRTLINRLPLQHSHHKKGSTLCSLAYRYRPGVDRESFYDPLYNTAKYNLFYYIYVDFSENFTIYMCIFAAK